MLGVRLSVPKGAVALLIVFVAAGIVITVALPNLGRESAGIGAMWDEKGTGGTKVCTGDSQGTYELYKGNIGK